MWIVGEEDSMIERGSSYAFDKAPTHVKSRYDVVTGGHNVTPMKGKSENHGRSPWPLPNGSNGSA